MKPETEPETMEQYIQRRTSDDGKQHWNLHPRDLAAMRYLLAQRATATDLLAACKSVRNWLLDTKQIPDDGISHPLFIKANNLVNAAIAKAEGRK